MSEKEDTWIETDPTAASHMAFCITPSVLRAYSFSSITQSLSKAGDDDWFRGR